VTVGYLFFLESDCWVTELVINQYKRPIFKKSKRPPALSALRLVWIFKKKKTHQAGTADILPTRMVADEVV